MMTSSEPVATSAPSSALSPALVGLLAVGAGLSAASIYYNQPLLDVMARDLGVSSSAVGSLPTLTQLGYAAGIFLFGPLGDRLDRRRVIVIKCAALAFALALAGTASSLPVLAVLSLAIGLLATSAQDFVPAAATLALPASRGKTVGAVMTGLLLGILLSRVVSGLVGDAFGWRAMYFGAAGAVAVLTAVVQVRLPAMPPTASERYGVLLRSFAELVARHPPLRRAAIAQALLSVAFSVFWSTLALVLARPPFERGSAVAGAFGLAGAAGALVAPFAGALADKRGPERVIRAGAGLVALSFLVMLALPGSLTVLMVTTVLFDLGVQSALIAHQTVVYALDPNARSRLNAVLVGSMFVGMAAGSLLAVQVLALWGFSGVALLAACAALLALGVRLLPARAL